MTEHICYACHLVRSCGNCCASCRIRCNAVHDCELRDRHMGENEGWEWFRNVTRVINDEDTIKCVPETIRKKVAMFIGKPVQLKLDFK